MYQKFFIYLTFLLATSSAFSDEYLTCDVSNIWTHSPDVSKRLHSSDISFFVIKRSGDKSLFVTLIQQGREIASETLQRTRSSTFNGKPTIQYEGTKDSGISFAQILNSNEALISVHELNVDLNFLFAVTCKD